MDLRLTEDQEMVRKTVRELATKEIVPIAAEIDETGRFPREVMEKMAAAVEAARLLAYRAALLEPKQGPDSLMPLAAIFSTDVAMDVPRTSRWDALSEMPRPSPCNPHLTM